MKAASPRSSASMLCTHNELSQPPQPPFHVEKKLELLTKSDKSYHSFHFCVLSSIEFLSEGFRKKPEKRNS